MDINQTIESLSELADETSNQIKTRMEDGENCTEEINQLNSLIRNLNDLKKSDKEEEKFWNKDIIVEIVKISGQLLVLVVNLIGVKELAKFYMKCEITDGRILTSSPGKGLANIFKFKSMM